MGGGGLHVGERGGNSVVVVGIDWDGKREGRKLIVQESGIETAAC